MAEVVPRPGPESLVTTHQLVYLMQDRVKKIAYVA